MVQPRGDRRREDGARAHSRAQEGGRHGDRRVPSQQGDSVDRGLAAALDAVLRAKGSEGIGFDPVRFPRRWRAREDAEAAAFIAATFAFGGVAQILGFLERLFDVLGPAPHAALTGPRPVPRARTEGLRYRFVSGDGVHRFLGCLRAAYLRHGSLEGLFGSVSAEGAGTRRNLSSFLAWFRRTWGDARPRERDFLFPDPSRGSACKRHNLFLRWMVRGADEVDLGLWSAPGPAELIVPLDTHLLRIGRMLGLTARRTADWRTAEEITAAFRAVAPDDPVRFDFALTRLGILKECTARGPRKCAGCPLAGGCRRPPGEK